MLCIDCDAISFHCNCPRLVKVTVQYTTILDSITIFVQDEELAEYSAEIFTS